MWVEDESFLPLVFANWRGNYSNNPIENFFLKMKFFKVHIKKWNKEVFGNIFEKLKVQEIVLCFAERALEIEYFEANVLCLANTR